MLVVMVVMVVVMVMAARGVGADRMRNRIASCMILAMRVLCIIIPSEGANLVFSC